MPRPLPELEASADRVSNADSALLRHGHSAACFCISLCVPRTVFLATATMVDKTKCMQSPSLTLLLVPARQGQREHNIGQQRHTAVPAVLLRQPLQEVVPAECYDVAAAEASTCYKQEYGYQRDVAVAAILLRQPLQKVIPAEGAGKQQLMSTYDAISAPSLPSSNTYQYTPPKQVLSLPAGSKGQVIDCAQRGSGSSRSSASSSNYQSDVP